MIMRELAGARGRSTPERLIIEHRPAMHQHAEMARWMALWMALGAPFRVTGRMAPKAAPGGASWKAL